MKDIEIIKKKDVKSLMVAVAMTAMIVSKAWAGDVALQPDVTLSADVLTVGDVFSGASNPTHILAPAPQPGKTMTLTARDLQRISDAFNLGWINDGSSVVIHRDGQILDRYKVEALLKDKLAKELQGNKFDVSLSERGLNLPLSGDALSTVDVSELKYDLGKGEVRGLLTASENGRNVLKKEVRAAIEPLTSVPVLSRAMNQGEIIGAADLQYIDMKTADMPTSLIIDAKQIIGQTPRRLVPAMKPMASADIVLPPAVKKGEAVTMVFKNGKLNLTTQGKSMQTGAVGDVIRVTNTTSQQVIQAVVTGERTVAVASPDAALPGNI